VAKGSSAGIRGKIILIFSYHDICATARTLGSRKSNPIAGTVQPPPDIITNCDVMMSS